MTEKWPQQKPTQKGNLSQVLLRNVNTNLWNRFRIAAMQWGLTEEHAFEQAARKWLESHEILAEQSDNIDKGW